MTFSSKNLSKDAAAFGTAFLTATLMASTAHAGTTEELTCYFKEAEIKAKQTQLIQKDHFVPVTSHFKNLGTNQDPKWSMATLMLNPETKKGYEWARMPKGHVCLTKSYSNVELYANLRLDPKSFMDKTTATFANNTGNGQDFSAVGINATLLVREQSKQFPMYRANVDDVINLEEKPLSTPTKYVEYLLGNPQTKEGTVLAANFNGKMIKEYTNVVGTPAANGVLFGAIFTPPGEDLVGLKSSTAPR